MPPLRLEILEDLTAHPDSTPSDVRRRLDKPHNTIDRELQALHMLKLVTLS
jgi:DNA-binding IclR family transcriptional regulator